MRKILIPCDGSDNALRAVRYAAALAKEHPDMRLELLSVTDPVPQMAHARFSHDEIKAWQAEESAKALQPAQQILDAEGVPYVTHHRTGIPATEIAHHVHESHYDAIVMGTRGLGPLGSVVLGSVATRVLHLVDIPVTLIK